MKKDNNNTTKLVITNSGDFKLFNIDLDFSQFPIPFNNIDTLECNTFKLTHISNIDIKLKYLYFIEVHCKYINSDYFSGLNKLQHLIIKNNNISSVHNFTFKGLIYLSYLDLDYNNITSIESDAFDGLIRLRCLRLNYNSLVELNTGIFTIYNKIGGYSYIEIRGNRIQIIKSGLFTTHYIERIDLSNNSISSIETNAFNTKLKILKLHDNVLSTIDENVFGILKNVKNITIYNNQIICDHHKFNWIFNSTILTLLNSSINKYVKCHQLNVSLFEFMKIKNWSNNKGKYKCVCVYTIYILLLYFV